MSNEQILAATEELESIVSQYYSELNSFIKNMENEIDNLRNRLIDISRNWDDQHFREFKSSVEAKIRDLEVQLDRAKNLLQIVAETRKAFADAIAILKS